jgi:acetyl-CoA C-acetyltransferase
MVEAFQECIQDAGIDKKEIQAAWLGVCFDEVHIGKSALGASTTLRLPNIVVTRVENFCASGTEAFRGAVYAVASGACDIALALGVEKLKDIGYGGLPEFSSAMGITNSMWFPNLTAPGFPCGHRLCRPTPDIQVKKAKAHSREEPRNGALNPKAHLRKAVTEDQVLMSPMIAFPLGLFDCCGVSDGAACAIVTTPEIAKSLGKKDIISVKALQIALSNGTELAYDWDGAHFITTTRQHAAYKEEGITGPESQISMMEVHDVSPSRKSSPWRTSTSPSAARPERHSWTASFDLDRNGSCQVARRLKCFGHP